MPGTLGHDNLKREFKHCVACSSTGLSEARKFFCQLVAPAQACYLSTKNRSLCFDFDLFGPLSLKIAAIIAFSCLQQPGNVKSKRMFRLTEGL